MDLGGTLGLIGWGLIGLLILYVMFVASQRAQRRDAKISIVIVLALLVGGLALNTLGAGLVFIQPQERGVVISALSLANDPVAAVLSHSTVSVSPTTGSWPATMDVLTSTCVAK